MLKLCVVLDTNVIVSALVFGGVPHMRRSSQKRRTGVFVPHESA
jgi:predicted nucleic acid-binding protein